MQHALAVPYPSDVGRHEDHSVLFSLVLTTTDNFKVWESHADILLTSDRTRVFMV